VSAPPNHHPLVFRPETAAFAGITVKGITGIAIRQGVVEQSQVRHARRRLQDIKQRFVLADEESDVVRASWMLDLDLAVTDSVHAQGSRLAEEFDRMAEIPCKKGD
jgi:hypothetical protein